MTERSRAADVEPMLRAILNLLLAEVEEAQRGLSRARSRTCPQDGCLLFDSDPWCPSCRIRLIGAA